MARVKRLTGTTVAMTTTAAHKAVPRGYHEIKHWSASAYRLGLAPALTKVYYYLASAGTYTDYTSQAVDGSSSTHVPLDGMVAADILYMGFYKDCPRGVYFDIGTNVQDVAATLDVEYCYDAAKKGAYLRLTGTVSAALTVGETVTGGTSGTTATAVWDNASTIVVVKNPTGAFIIGETISGAAQNISAVTAITTDAEGTGYWADVANDSDGTNSVADTLKQDGLYSWDLPASVPCTVNGVSSLHWIRFSPSTTLTNPTDINEIIPVCADVNYGYFEAGVEYHYAIDNSEVGAIETDMAAGSDTLDVTFVRT